MEPKCPRVLLARPGACDEGVDAAAQSALASAGLELIAAPPRASVSALAAAAVQCGARAIALWAPALAADDLCARLLRALEERRAAIPVAALGAGDPQRLLATGIDAAFGSSAEPGEIAAAVAELARRPGARPARPQVVGLDHVAVCVPDLRAAAQAFERVLGVGPARREVVADQKTEVVFFDLGGGASLELISPTAGNAGLEKFLQKRGPGLHHIALAVEAIDRALPSLQAEGVAVIDAQARDGARGHRVAFLHPKSAGGVLVELVERAPHEG